MKNFIKLLDVLLPYALILICIGLGWQNIQLKKMNKLLNDQLIKQSVLEALQPGAKIPMIRGRGFDNESVVMDYGSLILVYSPTCIHCAKSLPYWKSILVNFRKLNVYIVDATNSMSESSLKGIGLPDSP